MRRITLSMLVAVALAVGACGDREPAANETAAPCALDGATTTEQEGHGSDPAVSPMASLAQVSVQTSSCVDALVFAFGSHVPDWRLAYGPGPSVVVELIATSDTVLTEPSGPVVLDGTWKTLFPVAPSDIGHLAQTEAVGGHQRWVATLAGRRPIRASVRAPLLVVEIAAPSPRATTCSVDGVTLAWPGTWYADLSAPSNACRWFAPQPFAAFPGTNHLDAAVVAGLVPGPFPGPPLERATVVRRSETAVAGRRALAFEIVAGEEAMYPGDHVYAVRVDTAPATFQLVTSGPAGAAFDHAATVVDWMAARLRVR